MNLYDDSTQGSVGLLMSILLRYPEISSVKLEPELGELRFSFMVRRAMEDGEFDSFSSGMMASLEAFTMVTGRDMGRISIERHSHNDLSVVEITRELDGLCQEELSLMIGFIQDRFADSLLIEDGDIFTEEDYEAQDGIIDSILEGLRDVRLVKKLIGFREEGRVMVFNKNSAVREA